MGLTAESSAMFDKLLFPIDNSRETSHALPLVADIACFCFRLFVFVKTTGTQRGAQLLFVQSQALDHRRCN